TTIETLVPIETTTAYEVANQAAPLLDALSTLPAAQAGRSIIEMESPDGAASSLLLQVVEQMRTGLSVVDVTSTVLLKRWAAEAATAAPEFAATAAARGRQRQRFSETDRELR